MRPAPLYLALTLAACTQPVETSQPVETPRTTDRVKDAATAIDLAWKQCGPKDGKSLPEETRSNAVLKGRVWEVTFYDRSGTGPVVEVNANNGSTGECMETIIVG